ncbi:MAG: carboxypeptidase-like regulatory domain-containing protein [Candidatus Methanomethylicia archaeon]
MVKRLLFSLILIFSILMISIPFSNESLYYPLAPPFNEVQVFYHSRGSGTFSYMYDKNRGVMKGICTAVKNIGSILDEADLTLIFKGYLTTSFSGVIERLFVKYTLKGRLYVKSVCLPNTFSASAEVGVYVDLMGSRMVLASKTIELYYSGEDQYVFNDISQTVSKELNLRVFKGEVIEFTVTMHISSVALGALEDYSYSLADFSSGDYGLRIILYIGYLEDSYISASINPSKAYIGDSIEISGYLVDSNGRGIQNSILLLYLDSNYISSTRTESNGYFYFQYIVPMDIVPGEKIFKVVFEGDSGHLPSSQEFKLIVPSFSLHASHYSIKIPFGSVRGVDIYVNDIYNYNLPVEVKIGDLPNWISYGIVGDTLSIPPFQFHIYFTTYDVGEFNLEILAVGSDGQIKKILLNIESYLQPTYSISVIPYVNEVFQGSSTTYTVILTPLNGYNGLINLFLEVNGLNFSSHFSLNPVPLYSYEKQITLTIQVPPFVNVGSYDLIVKGVDSNGLIVYSNPFKLNVKEGPYFKISVHPTFSSIFSGETAIFYVNLTSFNGFNDYISLEVLCDVNVSKSFRFIFSENHINLSPSNLTKIVKLYVSPSSDVYGIFNFTIYAYSSFHQDSCSFSLEVKKSASIELYYVNWLRNTWHHEYVFMPYEAIGIIISYEPLKNLTMILPKHIFGEFNSSVIKLFTDENGTCRFIVFLNGLQCPIGFYEIYLLDDSGEIVCTSHICIDSLNAFYQVYNDYNYSRILFYLKWSHNNESIRFRGGNIEFILKSNIPTLNRCLINDSGVAIFNVPPIILDSHLIFHVHYAFSPIRVKSANSSLLSIIVPYRRISYDILRISFNDFNFNLNLRFYYEDNTPAKLMLLLVAYYDDSIVEFNYVTDVNGFASINFSLPPSKYIVFKLLCRDINDRWVSRVKDPSDLYWDENIGVLSYVNVQNGFVNFTFIPTSRFMNFKCTFYAMFYDEFDTLFYSFSTLIPLNHGSINYYTFSLHKKVHRILFYISVHGYEVFEGIWIDGDFSWKTL